MQLISKWPFITISYAVSLQKFKLHIWQLSKTFYLYKECKWSFIYSLGFHQFETFLKRWPYNIFSNGVPCRPMTSNDDHCAFLLSSLLTIFFFSNDHSMIINIQFGFHQITSFWEEGIYYIFPLGTILVFRSTQKHKRYARLSDYLPCTVSVRSVQ